MTIRCILAILGIIIWCDSFSQDLVTGLVGCYPFSGNADDHSGHMRNGIVNGATLVNDRFGNPASAYAFNGKDQFISIASEGLTNDSYTFSAWIFVSTLQKVDGAYQIIFVGDDSGRGQSFEMAGSESGEFTSIWIESPIVGLQDGCAMGTHCPSEQITNKWIHIAISYHNCSFFIYLNGQQAGSAHRDNNEYPAYYGDTSFANIGAKPGMIDFFNGLIDDVAIYNRVLSAEEVMQLFMDGLPCMTPIIIPLPVPTVQDAVRCGPGSVTLRASGSVRYRWYENELDDAPVYVGNPFITPTLSATEDYYVCSYNDEKESERVKVTVTIGDPPVMTCYSLSGYIHRPVSITTNVISGTQPFVYSYNPENGNPQPSDEGTATYTYAEPGNFSITVKVTDARGCADSCTTLLDIGEFFIPNVITPNDDSFNTRFTLYDKRMDHLREYNGTEEFRLTIFNRWGEQIFTSTNVNEGWKDVNASSGIYFYYLEVGHTIFKGLVSVVK